MAATMWGKVQPAPPTSSDTVPAVPVVELRAVDAGEVASAESGSAALAKGIRSLYEKQEFCDLVLVVGSERLPAHKSMLAAMSKKFRQHLKQQPGVPDPMQGVLTPVEVQPVATPAPATNDASAATPSTEQTQPPNANPTPAATPADGAAPTANVEQQTPTPAPPAVPSTEAPSDSAPDGNKETPKPPEKPLGKLELQVGGISTVESLRIMLSYVYSVGTGAQWEYNPTDAEVNKDILRLARNFGLSHLHEFAARWLTKGLTTANVVERLVTCEEFELGLLREKIIEQLTANPAELTIVSSSAEIMKHPRILQDLLMQVACLCGVGAAAKKPAEKQEKAEKVEKTEKVEKVEEAVEEKLKKTKAEKAEKVEKQVEETVEEPPEEPVKKPKKEQDKVKKEEPIEKKAEKVKKEEAPIEKPVAKRQKKGSATGA